MQETIPSDEPEKPSVLLPVGFLDGKWGYINTEGEIVIEPRFEMAWGFSEGVAVVKYRGKQGAINQKGEFVIEPRFWELAGPTEGLFVFSYRKNKTGYMDTRGNVIIKPEFRSACYFREGRAFVILREWERIYSFPNIEECLFDMMAGRPLRKPAFSDYKKFPFREMLRRRKFPFINKKYKTAFIDKQGNVIVKGHFERPVFDNYSTIGFYEGFAAVIIRENGFRRGYYLNRDGELVFGPFGEVCHFSEGYACVQKDELYGFINTRGEFVFRPYFTYGPKFFSEGRLPVLANAVKGFIVNTFYPPDEDEKHSHHYKWGYLNKNFHIAIFPAYDKVKNFSEGLAAVKVGEKWGYIDLLGRMVIEPQFDEAEYFIDGIAEVVIKNRWAYINRKGKIIWPHEDDLVVN